MVYHNYCMRLFAACMIFNDLVIKKAKYPKAFINFFPSVKNWVYFFRYQAKLAEKLQYAFVTRLQPDRHL